MKQLKLLVLIICIIALPGCETIDNIIDTDFALSPLYSRENADNAERFVTDNDCPQVQIVEELSSLSDFADILNKNEQNLVSKVNLTQVESACSYKSKSVTLDLKLAFEGTLGPKAKIKSGDKPFFSYPFFIAVTSPSGDILAKEVFSASMTYQPNQTSHTYYESLRQIIPIAHKSKGPNYKILVGFQLSSNQLKHNRSFINAQKEINSPSLQTIPEQ